MMFSAIVKELNLVCTHAASFGNVKMNAWRGEGRVRLWLFEPQPELRTSGNFAIVNMSTLQKQPTNNTLMLT